MHIGYACFGGCFFVLFLFFISVQLVQFPVLDLGAMLQLCLIRPHLRWLLVLCSVLWRPQCCGARHQRWQSQSRSDGCLSFSPPARPASDGGGKGVWGGGGEEVVCKGGGEECGREGERERETHSILFATAWLYTWMELTTINKRITDQKFSKSQLTEIM